MEEVTSSKPHSFPNERWIRRIRRAKRKCRTDWNKRGYALRKDLLKPTLSSHIDIVDYDAVSVDLFRQEFETKSRPAIIRGCMNNWAANRRWSFSRLKESFGKEKFKCGEDDDGYSVKIKLRHYMHYLENNQDDSPLYVFDSSFCEKDNKKRLRHDYKVPKYFRDDLFDYAPYKKRPPHRWFVMGAQRSGTDMHVDPLGTAAWNALVHGYKRWVIFPPQAPKTDVRARPRETDGEAITWFDKVYPRILKESRVQPIEFIQEPGDVVYMPGGWHHVVLNVSNTVAVTQNFCTIPIFPVVWRRTVKGRPKLSKSWLKALKEHRPDIAKLAESVDLNQGDGLPSSSSSDSSSSSSSSSSGSDSESEEPKRSKKATTARHSRRSSLSSRKGRGNKLRKSTQTKHVEL